MCNLAGYIGKGRKPINLAKLYILATKGVARGRHSLGVTYNNKTYKTTGDFNDLMEKVGEPFPIRKLDSNIVLIHNRYGTFGANTIANAHPFDIYADGADKEGLPNMKFMHNGTLKELKELAKLYNRDTKDFSVDSQMLGDILLKEGYDVLTKYKGAAACAFYDPHQPDELFLYRGGSHPRKDLPIVGERQLHYYEDKAEQAIYFNSTATPLKILAAGRYPVIPVPLNTILHFKENKLITTIPIKRTLINVGAGGGTHVGTFEGYTLPIDPNRYKNNYSNNSSNNNNQSRLYFKTNSRNRKKYNRNKKKLNKHFQYNTGNMPPSPQQFAGKNVFWFDGYYRRNGHLINGSLQIDMRTEEVYTEHAAIERLSDYLTTVTFFKGLWVKDEKIAILCKEEKRNPYIEELHEYSIAQKAEENGFAKEFWHHDKRCEGLVNKLPFMYYDLVFKEGVLKSFELKDSYRSNKIQKPDIPDVTDLFSPLNNPNKETSYWTPPKEDYFSLDQVGRFSKLWMNDSKRFSTKEEAEEWYFQETNDTIEWKDYTAANINNFSNMQKAVVDRVKQDKLNEEIEDITENIMADVTTKLAINKITEDYGAVKQDIADAFFNSLSVVILDNPEAELLKQKLEALYFIVNADVDTFTPLYEEITLLEEA